jgi:hypothetical protein
MVLKTHITFPKVCGVLVELKRKRNIDILVENFQLVMPGRDLFFFCSKSDYDYYKDYYDGDNMIKIVNTGVDSFTTSEYNDFFKTLDFWNIFKEYTHVLTINTRGCLCENSEYKIEDFFKYDFVGGYTPNKFWWNETQGLHNFSDYQCFNGGFSFRRIQAMKDILINFPPLPTNDLNENVSFRSYTEDLYFVIGLLILNSGGNTNGKKMYRIGLDEFATKFCSYTHYLDKTFCVNELDNYNLQNEVDKFLKYCPLFNNFFI